MSTISQSPGAYAATIARLMRAGGVAAGPGTSNMAIGDPTTMAPPQAAPSSYGVFGQGYAGALQADAADPFYGAAAEGRLSRLASGETNDYDRRLQQQNAQAAAMQQAAVKYGLFHELIAQTAGKATPGTYGPDASGNMQINPTIQAADRALGDASRIAGIHKDEAEGIHNMYQSGVQLTPEEVNPIMGNPITGDDARYNVIPGRANSNDQAALNSADAAMVNAKANEYDAHNDKKYAKSGGSGGAGYSIVVPVMTDYGPGMMTDKGKGDPHARGVTPINPVGGHNGAGAGASPTTQDHNARVLELMKKGFSVQTTPQGTFATRNGQTHKVSD